jgi:hypothetical protein
MKLFNSKNAISGLIVTVLLVAVSMAIGSVIVSWVTSLAQGNIQETKETHSDLSMCKQVNMMIWNVIVENPTQTVTGNISVFLENKGEVPISALLYRIYDNSGNIYFVTSEKSPIQAKSRGYIHLSERLNLTDLEITCSDCRIQTIEISPVVSLTEEPFSDIKCDNMARKYSSDRITYS